MNIIKLPCTSLGRYKGSNEIIAKADIVIASNGTVLKDRHGCAPRPATTKEIREARQL